LEKESFEEVCASVELQSSFGNFAEILAALVQPGGKVRVSQIGASDAIKADLTMAGLIDVSENGALVEGLKPSFSSNGVSLKNGDANSKAAVWKLMANDFNDASYELADEDALLANDEAPQKAVEASECGPDGPEEAKKRACKNCSCGLKEIQEAEEKGEATKAIQEPNESACGNCAKGDAFRCSSCPYLGTPAFGPGTKPAIKVNEDGSKVLVDIATDI